MIEGPSGAGKSDLALRLIDRGAVLVSDDRTRVAVEGGRVVALAPEAMAGRIEVRALGIATTPFVASAPVALVVRVGDEDERLPLCFHRDIAGVAVRAVAFDAFRASTPIKVEWALRQPGLSQS